MRQSKTWLFLFSFAGCCGTQTLIQPETRLIPVPDVRREVPAISVTPSFVPNWFDVLRADDDSTHIQLQVLLDSLQLANDSLKQRILDCARLYDAFKKRAAIQVQNPKVQDTPPPVICPPAEQHGLLWKIGFAVIVLVCGGAVIAVVKVLGVLKVF